MSVSIIVPVDVEVAASTQQIAVTAADNTEQVDVETAAPIIRSTFPTYTGQTVVTPSYGVQTLPTKDKIVESDITVEALAPTMVDVADTTATAAEVKAGRTFHGADGQLVQGSYAYSMIGDDAEFVQQVYDSGEIKLSATSFNGWTPSTTAKTIKASVTAGTFTADMANYEYVLRWRCEFDAAYADGTVLMGAVEREVAELWQVLYRRPASLIQIETNSFAGNACITYLTIPLNVYYTTNGARSYTYSTSYGVYPAVTAATFSSASANNPTVTIKTPSYSARCSTTYFTAAMAAAIDQDESKFRIVGELYRTRINGVMRQAYRRMTELYNNGLR